MTPRRWQMVGGWIAAFLVVLTWNFSPWSAQIGFGWSFAIGVGLAAISYQMGMYIVREWQEAGRGR